MKTEIMFQHLVWIAVTNKWRATVSCFCFIFITKPISQLSVKLFFHLGCCLIEIEAKGVVSNISFKSITYIGAIPCFITYFFFVTALLIILCDFRIKKIILKHSLSSSTLEKEWLYLTNVKACSVSALIICSALLLN